MTDFIVATREELELLTKRERQVYERYRHQGLKKDEICKELKISKATFRVHWGKALKKIRNDRVNKESPYTPIL